MPNTLFTAPNVFRLFRARPHLTQAIFIGLATGILLSLAPLGLQWSTRVIPAWDVGCLWFAGSMLAGFRSWEVSDIRRRAAAQDEGQGLILGLVLFASAASLVAVAVELSLAKGDQGFAKLEHVALAFVTVAVSWFVVQLIFALHYAHEFYADPGDDPRTQQQGGLAFPGETNPDYWDFLHFAVVIGVASQTADIAFTSQRLRRIGTVHSVVAFGFNTVILALTINLLAGLL